jgi:uncharacterized RDD family membrane protein YckC
MPDEQVHPSGAVYAPWGTRFGAELLDGLLILVVGLLFAFAVPPFVGLAIPFLYNGLLDGGPSGQTLGKRVVRIRAIDAGTGGPLGPQRGLLRALLPLALGVLGALSATTFSLALAVVALDGLWPLWQPQRQSWHDMIAGSVVVRAVAD